MNDNSKNWLEKSNLLNTLSDIERDMNLIEFRFFCLYLSKINARDINTRHVEISISEFENTFEIKFNTTNFCKQIRKIMSRTVEITSNNHKEILTLYSRFRYKIDNPKVIEISCNDMMLPYLFELKSNYTSYMLKNIIKLNSVSKIRLYEILKQYQKIGNVKIGLDDLQKMMCVKVSLFNDFKLKRLEPAIKDINEYTDIMVSYEKILSCRKVVALKFTITKKGIFKDIIDVPNKSQNTDALLESIQPQISEVDDKVMALYYELDKVYSTDELKQLLDICVGISSKPDVYLKNIYYQIRARKKKINNLFSYTLTVINADLKNSPPEEPKKKKSSSYDDAPSYNLDAYIKGLHHKYREEPFPSTQKYYFHSNEVTTFDIHTILEKNFNIYDNNLYDIKSLQGIIDYIYKKYNVLLIDVNPTGEYDKLAFGER